MLVYAEAGLSGFPTGFDSALWFQEQRPVPTGTPYSGTGCTGPGFLRKDTVNLVNFDSFPQRPMNGQSNPLQAGAGFFRGWGLILTVVLREGFP
jgi:hypothetical protein